MHTLQRVQSVDTLVFNEQCSCCSFGFVFVNIEIKRLASIYVEDAKRPVFFQSEVSGWGHEVHNSEAVSEPETNRVGSTGDCVCRL